MFFGFMVMTFVFVVIMIMSFYMIAMLMLMFITVRRRRTRTPPEYIGERIENIIFRFIGIINYGINNSYRFGYKNTERIFSYGMKRYLYLCDGRSPQPQRFKKSKCMQPLDVNTETGRYLQTVDNEIGQHSPRPQQNFYRGKL